MVTRRKLCHPTWKCETSSKLLLLEGTHLLYNPYRKPDSAECMIEGQLLSSGEASANLAHRAHDPGARETSNSRAATYSAALRNKI
jgi:hypothetical protein